MGEGLDKAKEVIQHGIWDNISSFLQLELLRFGHEGKNVVITIGLILTLIISLFVARIVLRIVHKILTRNLNPDDKLKFSGVYNFIRYFIYIFITISILSTSGIDITLLLTATAVLFIGLGLALRELYQDIIGGLYIIMDKSVMAGDIIEIDGTVGKVFDIKLRTTRVLTRDEKVIVVPNHKFITDTVCNFTQNSRSTRQSVTVRVPLDADVEKVRSILIACAKSQDEILKEPEPFVYLEEFGEFALMFGIYFFVTNSFREPRIKSNLRFEIEKQFRENGIKIPIPKRDVLLRQNS